MLVSRLCERTLSFKPRSESTAYGWRHAIKPFASMEVEDIDEDFAIDHRCDLVNLGYKSGYIRTRLGYLGTMWATGKMMNKVKSNPWEGLLRGLDKGKKKYPHKELDHFWQFRNDPLFMGIWLHGFRVNEFCCLLPSDFVLKATTPYINIAHNGIRKCKNDFTQRHVPIHPRYFSFIDKYPFTTNPGAGDNFSRRLKKATGISAHGIRHNFVTRMRQAGIEYSIAMAIIGHKPQGMTADYGEVLPEDMAKAIAKIS